MEKEYVVLGNGRRVQILHRIDGGHRNHIDLESMFTWACKPVKVDYLVVCDDNDDWYGVIKEESEPEFAITPQTFGRNFYDYEHEKDQFIPVKSSIDNNTTALYDCRSDSIVIDFEYDNIEVVKVIHQEDSMIRPDNPDYNPNQLRIALCKVAKGGKCGLTAVQCADGYPAQSKEMLPLEYGSIVFDGNIMTTIKDGVESQITL